MSLKSIVARGRVAAVAAAGAVQRLQVRLLAGEIKDNVDHIEPFGFTSRPLPGAEHVTLFVDGDRSHGVVVVVGDRRYRLAGLPEGGAALYDSFGSFIKLNADGTISVQAATRLTFTAPDVDIEGRLNVTSDITAGGDIKDQGGTKSMQGMRATYNSHKHGGSSTPDAGM